MSSLKIHVDILAQSLFLDLEPYFDRFIWEEPLGALGEVLRLISQGLGGRT
jgi:hypothetical protein